MYYKLLSVIFIAFWSEFSFSQNSEKQIKQVLILGDSHLNGDFGEFLQQKLHSYATLDIYSVAIGGAGSMHFTLPLKNFCCGYKIRETCYGEVIPAGSKCRQLEGKSVYSGETVAKNDGGRLSNIVYRIKPDYTLLCLGSNYTNAHQELVNIIRKQAPETTIIWIGPFRRVRLQERLNPILNTVKKNKNIFFVASDDIVGNDTITSGHFYGKTAKKWAVTVSDRIRALIW